MPAVTRSFADMKLAVQQLGQWENSSDITPAVLQQAINYGLIRGYDIMVGKWADYYTLDANFAIVAGTDSYVLQTIAPNFYKLRHLDVSSDGVRFMRCYPHDLEVAHRYTAGVSSSIGRIRYRQQGANLRFVPAPPAGFGKIYWIPLPPQFTDIGFGITGSCTFDVPEEELLVVYLANRALLVRSDLDTTSMDRGIADCTAGLRTAADSRDAGQPFYLSPYGPPNDYDDGSEW